MIVLFTVDGETIGQAVMMMAPQIGSIMNINFSQWAEPETYQVREIEHNAAVRFNSEGVATSPPVIDITSAIVKLTRI